MRIIAVVCILIGILIPTLVIYVDQQDSPALRIEIISIEEIALPIPTPVPSITLLQNKSQVETFMLADTTSQLPYTDTYKCGDFANDVVVNATAKGIEAKVIVVLWDDSYTTHAIVVFPTAEGDIYVDATSGDWWVNFGLGDSEYNSYLMTDSTQFGFKDKTVAMYGIKDNGYTNWLYVRPIPTPTPTPTPTPVPTPVPTPTPTPTPIPNNPDGSPYFCAPCESPMILSNVRWWQMLQCQHAQPLQTKEQVKEFMLWDKTDQNPYTSSFTCWNFAVGVIANAESFGIDAQHAIIVFPTYQDGMVYVDPTTGDCFVNFSKGMGEYMTYGMTDSNIHGFYNMTLSSYHMYSHNGEIDYWNKGAD
jgi:hypothetical protein